MHFGWSSFYSRFWKKSLLHCLLSRVSFNPDERVSVDTNPKNSFYRLHSPKCFKCGKPICPEPGEKEALRIIAMDKSFHKACFVCEVSFVRTFKPWSHVVIWDHFYLDICYKICEFSCIVLQTNIKKCNISLTDSKAGGCYPVNDKFFCKQCSMAEINEQMKRT